MAQRARKPADNRFSRHSGPQNISRWIPSVDSTLLAISSIEVWVVLSIGMRSALEHAPPPRATSLLQVSSLRVARIRAAFLADLLQALRVDGQAEQLAR